MSRQPAEPQAREQQDREEGQQAESSKYCCGSYAAEIQSGQGAAGGEGAAPGGIEAAAAEPGRNAAAGFAHQGGAEMAGEQRCDLRFACQHRGDRSETVFQVLPDRLEQVRMGDSDGEGLAELQPGQEAIAQPEAGGLAGQQPGAGDLAGQIGARHSVLAGQRVLHLVFAGALFRHQRPPQRRLLVPAAEPAPSSCCRCPPGAAAAGRAPQRAAAAGAAAAALTRTSSPARNTDTPGCQAGGGDLRIGKCGVNHAAGRHG